MKQNTAVRKIKVKKKVLNLPVFIKIPLTPTYAKYMPFHLINHMML